MSTWQESNWKRWVLKFFSGTYTSLYCQLSVPSRGRKNFTIELAIMFLCCKTKIFRENLASSRKGLYLSQGAMFDIIILKVPKVSVRYFLSGWFRSIPQAGSVIKRPVTKATVNKIFKLIVQDLTRVISEAVTIKAPPLSHILTITK